MCEDKTAHLVIADTEDETGSHSLYTQVIRVHCVTGEFLAIDGTRKFIAQFINQERALAAGKHLHAGGGLAR